MEIPLEISSPRSTRMVSLMTDFGSKDYYVASLKARLLGSDMPITLVDVTHEIATHDIVKASFFVQNYHLDFPLGTIHIVAVNNAYDFDPEMICFQYNGHFFIGPNNGLFSLVFKNIDEQSIRKIIIKGEEAPRLNTIITKAVHHIIEHGSIDNLGISLPRFDQKLGIQAVFSQNEIRATVIHVDHFGNVIVNLQKEAFESFRNERDFNIYIKPSDPIEMISESYAEVPVGDAVCLFNNSGYLTIGVNMGNVSKLYSLEKNDTIQVLFS